MGDTSAYNLAFIGISMVGLIARMDKSGLGVGQTRRLARLLKPDKIMLIDSTPFNGSQQFPAWYDGYDKLVVRGFPDTNQIEQFIKGLDVVVSCEMFYNNLFTTVAQKFSVKMVLVSNWEFLDYNRPEFNYPLPDKIITPSKWHLTDMTLKYLNVDYLPTPIFDDEFKEVRKVNLKRKGRDYLFINGKPAVHDRNGLLSLYRALELAKGDFTVTIKSQESIPRHPDPRLRYDFSNPEEPAELYRGFDALILPRRYGGQSLPMCEALTCGLPVVMTDISPNDSVLPKIWLVPATKTGEFMARTMIDVYSAEPDELANVLDTLDTGKEAKRWAYEISKQFEAESLRSKYEELLK